MLQLNPYVRDNVYDNYWYKMPYYHVRLLLKSSSSYSYEPNLSEDDIKKLAEQYGKGRKLLFLGEWVKPSDIREILIRRTSSHSKEYADMFARGVQVIFESGKGDNVTRQFITSPPTEKGKKLEAIRSKNVFIVHGRDHKPMKELKTMLYDFGLNPIVLHEQPSGSRTIVEKLEKYSDVGYALVILSPDDVGGPSKDRRILRVEGKGRARQNVILEFGYFMGLLGRDRVCCLYKGDVELPSDMHGIVYIPFKDSVKEVRNKIIKELKAAGFEIKM